MRERQSRPERHRAGPKNAYDFPAADSPQHSDPLPPQTGARPGHLHPPRPGNRGRPPAPGERFGFTPSRRYIPAMTRDEILKALDQVIDPVSGRSIVQQNMVTGLVLKGGPPSNKYNVGFALEVTPEQGKAAEPLRSAAEAAVKALPGVLSVTAVLTAHAQEPGHSHS